MSNIRQALAQTKPHVSLKAASRKLIQSLRGARTKGMETVLHGRSPLERLLNAPVQGHMDIAALKELLSDLMQAVDPTTEQQVAMRIEAMAVPWMPTIQIDPVAVTITGWPDCLPVEERIRWIGENTDGFSMSPIAAAKLVRDLDGLTLAGSSLQVSVDLPAGSILPAIPRGQRSRQRERGIEPWLPHLDDEGHYSLTPEPIANHHATLFDSNLVIDAFCGCGGDSIALARAGRQVIAFDSDQARVDLARLNAKHFQVDNRIEFRVGDAAHLLPDTLAEHPHAGVYLDPPWGGPDWTQAGTTWKSLIGREFEPCLRGVSRIVLKTPRSFDLSTLPTWLGPWSARLGLIDASEAIVDRARLLILIGGEIDPR